MLKGMCVSQIMVLTVRIRIFLKTIGAFQVKNFRTSKPIAHIPVNFACKLFKRCAKLIKWALNNDNYFVFIFYISNQLLIICIGYSQSLNN